MARIMIVIAAMAGIIPMITPRIFQCVYGGIYGVITRCNNVGEVEYAEEVIVFQSQ